MVQPTQPRYRYTVDRNDVITSVCPLWLAFARENGAPQLSWEAVVGHSLWEFIEGEETKQLYQTALQRVRDSHTASVVPFRCDSPTLRRHMRLELTPEAEGGIQLESVLERVEQTTQFNLLEPTFPRSQQMLTLCSCCKRILVETCGWLEIDDVAVRLQLFDKDRAPRLRNSVCPDCLVAAGDKTKPNNHGRTTEAGCSANITN